MAFKDALQCNATAKRTGKQCQLPAVSGSTKCRVHGGKTPRGSASPNWKGKGRSKYLPQRLADSYAELEHDADYTDLRSNMRLREVFIREKLAMLDSAPESAKVWTEFNQLWLQMERAFKGDDYGTLAALLTKGSQILDERMVYFETQKEIRADLAEQRADSKAIASIENKNSVTVSELMTFVSALLNFVNTHVSSKQEKSAVFNAVETLISVDTGYPERVNRLTDG